jgi:2-polyprenyl-3-methyl-5-hydroxy-6-metoxy-1,4-benzoquinol methylase
MATDTSPAQFWNALYENREIQIAQPDTPIAKAALAHFGDVRGKRILDIGCGAGEYALLFASLGAEVVAIDLSSVCIEKLSAFKAAHGIENLHPHVASATDLAELGPFDLAFGTLVLHHIEPFADFGAALAQALIPGGKAFFFENNAAIGPLALFFREHLAGKLWFPKYGDQDEHPLTPAEVDSLRDRFALDVHYPELAYFRLVSHYIFRYKVFPKAFNWLDDTFYRVSWFRKYSYYQYLFLTRTP